MTEKDTEKEFDKILVKYNKQFDSILNPFDMFKLGIEFANHQTKENKSKIDLDALEKKIDDLIENSTPEEMNDWINRSGNPQQTEVNDEGFISKHLDNIKTLEVKYSIISLLNNFEQTCYQCGLYPKSKELNKESTRLKSEIINKLQPKISDEEIRIKLINSIDDTVDKNQCLSAGYIADGILESFKLQPKEQSMEDFINIVDELPNKGKDIVGLGKHGVKHYCFRCACHMEKCKEWRDSFMGASLMVNVVKWKYYKK